MRISDWSSDVCSSDLRRIGAADAETLGPGRVDEVVGIGLERHAQLWRERLFAGAPFAPGAAVILRSVGEIHEREFSLGISRAGGDQTARASCRARVCQYVSISVVAVSLTQQINNMR